MTSRRISTPSSEIAAAVRRLWPLAAGGMILAALWLGPLPELARVSFSAHMVLHLGLIGLAAPALAVGLARLGAVAAPPGGWVLWAVALSGFELVVVWGWHLPALHEAAALSHAFFALQQLTFLVAGVVVWWPGLAGAGRRSAGAGMIAAGFSFTHMSMLGVLLTTAPALLYPDGLCGGAFGLDPLADQRLGGVMMAVFGGLPYLVGSVFFAHRFLEGGPARREEGDAA